MTKAKKEAISALFRASVNYNLAYNDYKKQAQARTAYMKARAKAKKAGLTEKEMENIASAGTQVSWRYLSPTYRKQHPLKWIK